MTDPLEHAPGGGVASARRRSAERSIRWIAHRGWSTRFPENSLAAFAAALAARADEIEFDVRQSADDVSVVLHDPFLDRVSDLRGPVEALSHAELERAAIIGPGGGTYPDMGVATLAEVLRLFSPHVGMNVHVKTTGADAAALRVVAEAARANPQRHIYIAGDEAVLEAALEACPDVPRCCLSRQREPEALLRQALHYRCAGLQFRWDTYDADAVAEARAHGLFANLFYADTPDDARRAVEAGIDGVLTNDIGAVRPAVDPARRAAPTSGAAQ